MPISRESAKIQVRLVMVLVVLIVGLAVFGLSQRGHHDSPASTFSPTTPCTVKGFRPGTMVGLDGRLTKTSIDQHSDGTCVAHIP